MPITGKRIHILTLRSSSDAQHYHLLRLEFSEGLYSTQATFFHHSSLRQELPVADTSLSEDVVLVLGIDTDGTLTMFILQWREGTMVSVKTDVKPVSTRFHLITYNPTNNQSHSQITPIS